MGHQTGERTPPAAAPITPEQLQRQAEAIQSLVSNSLRGYVDDRLKSRTAPGTGFWSQVARVRPEIYFVALLALLLLSGALSRGDSQAGETSDEPSEPNIAAQSPTAPADHSSLMAQRIAADPDGVLRRLARTNSTHVADWLLTVARAEGMDSALVPPDRRVQLRALSEKVRSGNADLTADEVARLRWSVFTYAYGRWELQEKGRNEDDFQITYRSSVDFDANVLNSLVQRLDLRDVVGATLDDDDPRLRTAVVLRWIELYAPGDPL